MLEELLKLREEEQTLTERMIKAGVVGYSADLETRMKIADLKARLAKAKNDAEVAGKR